MVKNIAIGFKPIAVEAAAMNLKLIGKNPDTAKKIRHDRFTDHALKMLFKLFTTSETIAPKSIGR